VGEPTEVMYDMIEVVNAILPKDRPRYLMGVGTPQNLLEAIERGVDMFDCVMPTRNGRNGLLFTAEGTINIKNKKWESCFRTINEELGMRNEELRTPYTLAYIHHLIRAEEILGLQICSIVNLQFYLWLVGEARKHIIDGDYAAWKASMLPKLGKRL
jgi:queuine tRNA-ribosyltransferase